MIDHKLLADKLKTARKAAGLTQAELARRAGLSLFTLAKLEQAKVAQPSFYTILALVEQLQVSIDELVELKLKGAESASHEAWAGVSWCFVSPLALLSGWQESIGVLANQAGIDPVRLEELYLNAQSQLASGASSLYEFEQSVAEQFDVPPRRLGLRDIWLEHLDLNPQTAKTLRQLFSDGKEIGLLGSFQPQLLEDLVKQSTLPSFISQSDHWVLGDDQAPGELFERAERVADKLPKQLLYIGDDQALVDVAASRNWQTLVIELAD